MPLTSQCRREVMMEVCAPYTDHDDEIGFSEPFVPLFSENRPSDNKCRFFSLERVVFCGLWSCATRPAKKVTRAPIERLIDAVCYAAIWLKSSSCRHFGE